MSVKDYTQGGGNEQHLGIRKKLLISDERGLGQGIFAGHKLCGLPRFGRTRLAQVQKVEGFLPLTLLQ
jgi:hypothetical protein